MSNKNETDEKVKQLVDYIANAAQSESGFLYPNPSWYVFATPLLDEIAEIFEVDKKDIKQYVDVIADDAEFDRKVKSGKPF